MNTQGIPNTGFPMYGCTLGCVMGNNITTWALTAPYADGSWTGETRCAGCACWSRCSFSLQWGFHCPPLGTAKPSASCSLFPYHTKPAHNAPLNANAWDAPRRQVLQLL